MKKGESGALWRAAMVLRSQGAGLDGEEARRAEEEVERLEGLCDAMLLEARATEHDETPQTVAEMVATVTHFEEPDELALALLVEAVEDSNLGPAWQRAETRETLAWLIVGNPAAKGRFLALLSDVPDPAEPGALLSAAKGRA